MYISGTLDLRILAHERWIQVLHWLHSIIALPANGFMQKHVTRSQESSSAKRKTTNSTIHTTAIWQWHTPKSKAPIYFKRRTNWTMFGIWNHRSLFPPKDKKTFYDMIANISKNVCFFASLYLTVQWEKSRNCRIKSQQLPFLYSSFLEKADLQDFNWQLCLTGNSEKKKLAMVRKSHNREIFISWPNFPEKLDPADKHLQTTTGVVICLCPKKKEGNCYFLTHNSDFIWRLTTLHRGVLLGLFILRDIHFISLYLTILTL